MTDEEEGSEKPVMVTEVRKKSELKKLKTTHEEIASRIRSLVAESEGLQIADIVLIKQGTIPKTVCDERVCIMLIHAFLFRIFFTGNYRRAASCDEALQNECTYKENCR